VSSESCSWYENPVSRKARTGSIPVPGTLPHNKGNQQKAKATDNQWLFLFSGVSVSSCSDVVLLFFVTHSLPGFACFCHLDKGKQKQMAVGLCKKSLSNAKNSLYLNVSTAETNL
jgi:hypothetical protein